MKYEEFERCVELTSDDVVNIVNEVLKPELVAVMEVEKQWFRQRLTPLIKAKWPQPLLEMEEQLEQALNSQVLLLGPVHLKGMPVVPSARLDGATVSDLRVFGVIDAETEVELAQRIRDVNGRMDRVYKRKRELAYLLGALKTRGDLEDMAPKWSQYLTDVPFELREKFLELSDTRVTQVKEGIEKWKSKQ